jgi:hypothetical protein
MQRRAFCRLATLAGAGGTVSCSSTPEVPTEQWPGTAFDSVRAFVYACEADKNKTFVRPDGSLHPGVLNGKGVLLSRAQTDRLLAAGRRYVKPTSRSACYVPHHAFVFYAAGRPVACMEICFTCHRHNSSPSGLPQAMDYDAIWTLLHELGVYADITPGCYLRRWIQGPSH